MPGENPVVEPGSLDSDLVRRDFTINAMAQDLLSGQLIDPHRGQQDLAERRLVFLHDESVSDDPTRVIRASRYAARLGFVLSPEALQQVTATVRRWPWSWQLHDAPDQAPPALANRLRMELDRLFAGEPWALALDCLEEWQAMALLDPSLQHDRGRNRRIAWAQRLGLPLLPAWLAGAPDPEAVARRLGVPGQQQRWLKQLLQLQGWCPPMHLTFMRPQTSGLLLWRPRAGCQKQWPSWFAHNPRNGNRCCAGGGVGDI
jgi:poly(A) polymerase